MLLLLATAALSGCRPVEWRCTPNGNPECETTGSDFDATIASCHSTCRVDTCICAYGTDTPVPPPVDAGS